MTNELKPTVLINPGTIFTGEIAQKIFPPIGMMYLVASLKAADEPVRLIDANAAGLDDDGVIRQLEKMDPFAIGVPVFDITLPSTAALVRTVAKRFPDAWIFAGGPAATVEPARIATWMPQINYILRGEAEESIVDFIRALRSGRPVNTVPGIYSPSQLTTDLTPPARVADLNRIDLPDRECVAANYEARRYYTVLVPDRKIDCIVTSRGCPHRCQFCYNWRFRQTYRSVDSCLQEIQIMRDAGVRTVEILDDNFTTNRDRAMEFFDRLVSEKFQMRFRIKARADGIDDNIMKAGRLAGVYQVSIGAESGSPAMLTAMNKRITPETITRAVQAIMNNGAYCHASFIVGYPGETAQSMEETVRLIEKIRPTSVSVDPLSPYQGTPVYEQAKQAGTLVGDWSVDPQAELPWIRLDWTKTRRDLDEAQKNMLFRIYWNRRYITRYAGMIIGGMNPTMGRYLAQEAGLTWPGLNGIKTRIKKEIQKRNPGWNTRDGTSGKVHQ